MIPNLSALISPTRLILPPSSKRLPDCATWLQHRPMTRGLPAISNTQTSNYDGPSQSGLSLLFFSPPSPSASDSWLGDWLVVDFTWTTGSCLSLWLVSHFTNKIVHMGRLANLFHLSYSNTDAQLEWLRVSLPVGYFWKRDTHAVNSSL